MKYESETKKASCGITYFLQKEIGDILSFNLPAEGRLCLVDQKVGQIEGTSNYFNFYSPVTMTVIKVESLGQSEDQGGTLAGESERRERLFDGN